jgi:hypothetical protein
MKISEKAAKSIRTAAERYPDAMREAAVEASRDPAAMESFRKEAEWKAVKAKIDEATGHYDPEAVLQDTRAALREAQRSDAATKRTLASAEARVKYLAMAEADARLQARKSQDELKAKMNEALAGKDAKYDRLVNDLKSRSDDELAAHQAILKYQAEARRERAAMEKLARQITRPISSKTVDVSMFRMLRGLQETVDPKFRAQRTHDTRDQATKFYDYYRWAIENDVTGRFKSVEGLDLAVEMAKKKSLDQFTLPELAEFADRFNAAYKDGQERLRTKERLWKDDVDANLNRLFEAGPALKKSRVAEGPLFQKELEKMNGGVMDHYNAWMLDMQRFSDLFDGGKARFNGEWYKTFYRSVNEAENQRLRLKDSFDAEFHQVLVDNGFTGLTGRASVSRFYDSLKVRDREIPLQEAMDVYLKWKNDRSRAALIGDGLRSGNRIDQAWHDDVVAAMDTVPGARAVADWILNWFNSEETRGALEEVANNEMNKEFNREENYTPIRRKGIFAERTQDQIVADIAGRQATVMGKLQDGMTKDRVDIAAHNQTPLILGVIDALSEYQNYTSRYVTHLPVLKHLQAIVDNPEFRSYVTERAGVTGLRNFEAYLRRVANPSIDKSPADWAKALRGLGSSTAFAFLGANLKTITMQIPAFMLYAGELDNPLSLGEGIVGLNFGWGHVWKTMEELSPQWKDRLGNPMAREIINGTKDNLVKMMSDQSMRPIGWVDQVAAGWGWWAKFREGQKKGLPDKEAAALADEAMLRTQQTNATKDDAQLYGRHEALKWWNMFQGPAHKTWQQITYDLPNKEGVVRKAALAAGVAVAGVAMWTISMGRPPKSEEDWQKAILGQTLGSTIPLLGTDVQNLIYGYQRTGNLTPWEGASEVITGAKKLNPAGQTTDEFLANFATEAYTGLALTYGLPLAEVKRVAGIGKDWADGKEVHWGDVMGKDWGRK